MSLPRGHFPDGRSAKRPVQLASATATLIERAHSARTGRGLHRLKHSLPHWGGGGGGCPVTHPRTNNRGHGAKALGVGGCRGGVLGAAARRLRQSDEGDRGDRNALALPNSNCHPIP